MLLVPHTKISPAVGGLLLALASSVPFALAAQEQRTVINGFGHVEQHVQRTSSQTDAYFAMGEHSLFITSVLNPRLSYLGEFALRFNASSASGYVTSIERAFVRYRVADKHSVIAGKVHTPVNYWNDVYHHGRLFFPVVDRPYAFGALVPLHTMGLQVQGQNLGAAKFGYDLMVGNHISSTDVFQEGVSPAMMAAAHVKPIEGMRIGASLYADHMETNGYGVHAGHTAVNVVPPADRYTGALDYALASTSVAYFGPRLELLHEFSYNRTRTDSLGAAGNVSSFAYLGYRFGKAVPYLMTDRLDVADNDLHTYPLTADRQAVGVRFELAPTVILKAQLERARLTHQHTGGASHAHGYTNALRLQLAYGIQ